MDRVFIKRLAFIKYLYQTGENHSKSSEPLSSISLLLFHDAVELFLQLASEKMDSGKKQIEFMEYWEVLSKKLNGKELFQKESMRRLNKARVSLKHNGSFPSKLDIEIYQQTAYNFFVQNTPQIFGLDFHEVSLIDYIEPEVARELLKSSLKNLKNENIYESIKEYSIAFERIIDHYDDIIFKNHNVSPLDFGPEFVTARFLRTYDFHSQERRYDQLVAEALDKISGVVKVLALGLNYNKYIRFRAKSFHVFKSEGGGYSVPPQVALEDRYQSKLEELYSQNDMQFCIDFVIEAGVIINSL